MKKKGMILGLGVSIIFLVVLVGGTVQAGSLNKPVHLRFASHVIGGTGYTQAAVVSQYLRPLLPEGSTIDVLPYSGGIGNIKLIEAGKADFGMNVTASDKWAVEGKVIFDKKFKKLRHVGCTDVFYLCVYATNKSGITSLGDAFKAKKGINWYALNKGATGEVATRLLMDAYGASYDKLKDWGGSVTNTGWVNIAPALRDGRGDIVSHGVGKGHPSMTEIALTVDGRFLDLSEEVREKLTEYGFDKADLPANTFKHQPEPVKTVAYYMNISASSDVPEEVVYLLTKVLVEERESLTKGHKSFGSVKSEFAAKRNATGAPLHPGAARYYKEKGLIN